MNLQDLGCFLTREEDLHSQWRGTQVMLSVRSPQQRRSFQIWFQFLFCALPFFKRNHTRHSSPHRDPAQPCSSCEDQCFTIVKRVCRPLPVTCEQSTSSRAVLVSSSPARLTVQSIAHNTLNYISARCDFLSFRFPGTAPQAIVRRNRIPVKFPQTDASQASLFNYPTYFQCVRCRIRNGVDRQQIEPMGQSRSVWLRATGSTSRARCCLQSTPPRGSAGPRTTRRIADKPPHPYKASAISAAFSN